MNLDKPKVFISYSWDDEEHQGWVRELAEKLRKDGVDATIDQFDLQLGDRLPQYMETSIREADYVLVICTPMYREKANNRLGGVGYEGHIISGELFSQHNERKFIPIIRKGNRGESIPTWLEGKLDVDFTNIQEKEDAYNDLLTTLYNVKALKPELGRKPEFIKQHETRGCTSTLDANSIEDTYEEIKVMGILTDKVTVPKMDGTRGSALYKIPFKLSKNPSVLWKKIFVDSWNYPPSFSTMHRPGIASVLGDEIILDGTTIQEVKNTHRETLILATSIANKKEKEYLILKQSEDKKRRDLENEHFSEVNNLAETITFD